MQVRDATLILDRRQLRQATLDDEELMREILVALVEDTSIQVPLLQAAVRSDDAQQCARLAHYSKGACANVGANRTAAILERIETLANTGALSQCGSQLALLAGELERLRQEEI